MSEELKPCPFCREPLVIGGGFNPIGRCLTEGCWMSERQIGVSADAPREVEQWNRRAEPEVAALVERFRAALPEWMPAGHKDAAQRAFAALITTLSASRAEEYQSDHSSDVRNMVQAAEQRGADRAFEEAAAWHDTRTKGPDVFESELHEVSAAALRYLKDNRQASTIEALEAAQAAIRQRIGGQ